MSRKSASLRVAALLASVALAAPSLAQGTTIGGSAPAPRGAGAQPGGNRGGTEVRVAGGPGMGMGMFGGDRSFDPPVQSEQLDRYSKILGLDPDQKTAAQALLEAQIGQFNPAAKAARDKMEAARESFRESRDPSVWRDLGSVMEDLRTKRAAVEKEFFGNLKSLLSPDQAAKFPAVERTHRRETTIGRGLMSGERVDLVSLVDKAALTDKQKADLKGTLDQYEIELDRELAKRNEIVDQFMSAMGSRQGGFQGMMDDPKMQELFTKGREAAMKVRDVNRRFERQVESSLPDDKRAAFADEFKRQSFPMIYRPTYASHVLDAADKMTDLTEPQKSGLSAMRESFARELGAMNTQLEAATQESEENFSPANMMRGGGGNDKLDGIRKSRRELVDATVKKVNDLLTETQRTKLPERGEDFQGGPGGGPGGPGGADNADRPRRRRGGDNGGGPTTATPAPPPPSNPR
jgi:hypothetical protein